jgi:predicted metal-dependent peptidase
MTHTETLAMDARSLKARVVETLATERVLKARAELIMSRRFYGVLVSNVEPVASRHVETMATDGRRHFFNPDFIATLTQTQLLAVQAHESEHDARHHSTRRNGRDKVKWNIACDLAINVDLKDERFDLPPWVLLDPQYRGMSAEDIYRARELDEKKAQEPPAPEPEPSKPSEDGDDEADDKDSDDTDDEADDEADDEEGTEEGEDGDEDAESESGDDDNDDAEEGDDAEGDAEGTEDDADAEGDGEGKGTGEVTAPFEFADDGTGESNGDASADAPQSFDPGRCGEVLDAADDAADLSDLDQQWERITRQAASMAKAVGQLPGHVTREIEAANKAPNDWRETLRAWFDQGALRTETWSRPNRRFAGQGLVLPGSRRDGVNKAIFIIDTSGSMDNIALACVKTEAQAALDDGAIDEAVVIYGDTRVTRVDNFRTGDEIEFDPRGGGGTNLKPAFAYVTDEHPDASLIVAFTDLYIGDPGPEPSCPVLFAVTGYPATVKAMMERTPWNAPAIDVGSH